jgi:predicted DsbA family dithiol-disulfide isomerase
VQPFRIVAYSDYVCPWCYIGFRRIEQLRREFEIEVEWRPFELHPETPRSGARLDGRMGGSARARAYENNIIGIARESSIAMKMPAVISNSHRALEAAEFAREHAGADGFDAYHAGLFSAYFEAGLDIGDTEVLCDVARACGVDDQRLRQALADETYTARIDELTDAARRDEILSTPTFVFPGGFRLIGGQEYAVFQSVTRRLMERIAAGIIEVAP